MIRKMLLASVSLALVAGAPASAQRARYPLTESLRPVNFATPDIPEWTLRPGRLIDVGGHRLNLYCMGRGGPTILMFSGGGWGAMAFGGIQPAIAEHGRVCSYDRAGIGFSEVGNPEPSPEQPIRDVATMMERAGERGPFVLVGWSLGGMEARQFAADYPDRVAGLVTIDGSAFDDQPLTGTETWHTASVKLITDCHNDAVAGVFRTNADRLRACARLLNPLDRIPAVRAAIGDRVLDPAAYAIARHRITRGSEMYARLRATRRTFGDLPVRALLASEHIVPPANANASRETIANPTFVRFAVTVAGWSTNGRVVTVPGTGHAIHFQRPDAVVDVIREVHGLARARAARRR